MAEERPSQEDETASGSFAKNLEKLKRAKGLILDVRLNGGGDSRMGREMLRRLTEKPMRTSRFELPKYPPAYRAWGRVPQVIAEDGTELKPYPGALTMPVLLTTARTFWAAEDFVIVYKSMNRGPVIGTATGGSTGQPVSFRLPGGGGARECAKRDFGPGGEEFVGKRIAPDFEVQPTAEDFRAGRDPVLEKAVEVLQAAGGK